MSVCVCTAVTVGAGGGVARGGADAGTAGNFIGLRFVTTTFDLCDNNNFNFLFAIFVPSCVTQ